MKTKEFRCKECNKLLATTKSAYEDTDIITKKEYRLETNLEIKCPRCKHISTFIKELFMIDSKEIEITEVPETHKEVLGNGDNLFSRND